jgi:hypothetical protein
MAVAAEQVTAEPGTYFVGNGRLTLPPHLREAPRPVCAGQRECWPQRRPITTGSSLLKFPSIRGSLAACARCGLWACVYNNNSIPLTESWLCVTSGTQHPTYLILLFVCLRTRILNSGLHAPELSATPPSLLGFIFGIGCHIFALDLNPPTYGLSRN